MFEVTEEAVKRVSKKMIRAKYNLKELFKRLEEENPRVAEYIQCQADQSNTRMEIIGTGVVVYMLIEPELNLRDEDETDEIIQKMFEDADLTDPQEEETC